MTTYTEPPRMIDVHGPDHVQIEVIDRGMEGLSLYVHVDGVTLLRIGGLNVDNLHLPRPILARRDSE